MTPAQSGAQVLVLEAEEFTLRSRRGARRLHTRRLVERLRRLCIGRSGRGEQRGIGSRADESGRELCVERAQLRRLAIGGAE